MVDWSAPSVDWGAPVTTPKIEINEPVDWGAPVAAKSDELVLDWGNDDDDK